MSGEATEKSQRSRPPAEMVNSSFGTSPRSRLERLVGQERGTKVRWSKMRETTLE